MSQNSMTQISSPKGPTQCPTHFLKRPTEKNPKSFKKKNPIAYERTRFKTIFNF